MKTLLLILVTMYSFAQKGSEHYISFSSAVDVRNLFVGSTATQDKSGLDYFFQFGMVGNNTEVTIGYECFKHIQFSKFTVGVGYHFPLYARIGEMDIKTVFIPSIEPTLIDRWGTRGGANTFDLSTSSITVGMSFALRWHLSNTLAAEYLFNVLPRIDIYALDGNQNWQGRASIAGIPLVSSNYFKLVYKIDR